MRRKKQPRTEEIGIRELKSRASEVVRAVKEERARYVITQRGKPAAIIVPLDAVPLKKSDDEVWDRLMKIREELGKGWQSEKSAVEILSEMRRCIPPLLSMPASLSMPLVQPRREAIKVLNLLRT